ncbi:MAG: diaminopimelate dehydrogenase [Burkholderiaceae bacterium]|nr:diaminopimelate dehydrogenase [Burkholderiaceae bacterium]
MNTKIRVGIVGYGNLGRGVESALGQNPDMELVGVFTRRSPDSVVLRNPKVAVHKLDDIVKFQDAIDVLILCGGSKSDLPQQGPALAAMFNTVDSFDTHAKVPEYFHAVDQSAEPAGNTAIISVGWDPGLFSLNRLYGEAVLPEGATYTFWGKGVSQGHSDALRRIPGVKDAIQYTLPVQSAIEQVRSGSMPQLSTRQKHTRQCFVVLEEGSSAQVVQETIVNMPDYFSDYDTEVNFLTHEELKREHAGMPHGGFVIRSGKTGAGTDQVVEYALKLDSNPEFTSSVLVAYARAAWRLNQQGSTGAKTVLDIAPGLLSPKTAAALRKELL